MDQRVALRVLSLPLSGQPLLDRVFVVSGRLPENANEVLLGKHRAQHYGLVAGDTIRLDTGGVAHPLRVSGVGVSAEYLWVARDAHDIFPSPDEFGVGWMQRSALQDLSGDDTNQLLVDLSPGASVGAVMASVRAALGDSVVAVTPKEKLVGIRLLQMDVDGYRGMAGFFPVFFLGVGAFIVAALLARLVDAQRPVLGTLMALGVSRVSVLVQVLAHALALGAVGAVAGALAGIGCAPELTRAYAADLGIPFVTARPHIGLSLTGIAIGVMVALASGLLPALHASALAPAEAMRPPKPSTSALAGIVRRFPAPLSVRLATRDVLGRPLRSVSTALGVSAALVLVLATGSMLDSMRRTFSVLFADARRYDLRVDLIAPERGSDLRPRFASATGVAQIELLVELPASMAGHGRSADGVLLQGLADDAQLARSVDLDGHLVAPRAAEVIVTRALASKLGVAIGDPVDVRVLGIGDATFVVGGFADGAMGPTASARLVDVQHAYGLGDRVTSVAIATNGHAEAARAALGSMSDVAHVEDVRALRDQVGTMMGLGWAMLGAMLFFGAVLAAAILFNTATLGILERRRELATLRALGCTQREISAGITLEHALLAALGLAVGYPLAAYTSRKVLALYSNDLFRLPYVMSPQTITFAVCGIVAVLFVAQWPALRRLARASLAEAVRTRE
jgi:putative ABC transport system permease protein